MKKIVSILLSAVMLFSASAMAADTYTAETENEFSGEYQAYDQIVEYVSKLYIDEFSKEEIQSKGLSGLLKDNDELLVELLKATLSSLDDYSEFYTEQEYKQFQENLNHTFYGIGVLMHMAEDGYVEISGFAEGSDNAQNAGFKIGDKIVKVNGVSVSGQSVDEVREKVIGEEGTTVEITVLRENGEIADLTVTRVAVNGQTVSSGIFNDNIGYIKIVSFSEDTASEFEKALNLMRENNVKKIILDLRGNGGGLVPVAIKIAQQIVPKGKIIDVKFRDSKNDTSYTSALAKKEFDFAVLVNEYTASSSEILSSALQDSKAAVLVGTKTFGKAVIQYTYPLKNGSVFKLTVGKYVTRAGNEINKVGLMPDIYVENEINKLDTAEYTPFDYKTPVSLGQKSLNAKAAKERLYIMGLYDGEADDVFDTALFEAIKNFQRANSVFAYGVLDVPTQKLIEETASNLDVMDDKQLKAAYEKLGGDAANLYK